MHHSSPASPLKQREPPRPPPLDGCRVEWRASRRPTRSYLAVCGTDRDSDIGSQHDCECRRQFNSESTVEEGGERSKETFFIVMTGEVAADGNGLATVHVSRGRTSTHTQRQLQNTLSTLSPPDAIKDSVSVSF